LRVRLKISLWYESYKTSDGSQRLISNADLESKNDMIYMNSFVTI